MLISINHLKGGTGKSTIFFNLAIEISKLKNYKVEVVDLDVQKTLTLNNYLRKELKLKPFQVRSFDKVETFENYIKTDNDSKIILVDTGGFDSGLNRVVALVSDLIITPVSDSIVELQGLKTYENILKELSEIAGSEIQSHVLLNSIDPRKKDFSELKNFVEDSENFSCLNSVIRRRNDFKNSIANGKSVVEFNRKSKAAGEIKSLTKEIKYLLNIQ
jgi:chromosome partitioning protein